MSAALNAPRPHLGSGAGFPGPTPTPRLVLVPTGAAAVRALRQSRPSMRLTRFGGLVVLLLLALALGGIVAAVTSSVSSGLPEARAITVEAGETLSQIATRELPGVPLADGLVELQLLNELPTSQLHAGQTLRIPVR